MVNFGSRRTNADLGFRHSLSLPRKIVPVRNARPIRSADAARSEAVRNAVPIRRFSAYFVFRCMVSLGGMAMKGALCAIGRFLCAVRSGHPDAVNRSGHGVSCRSRSVRRMGDSAGLLPASVRGRLPRTAMPVELDRTRRKPASASVRCACPDRCPRGRCDGRKAVFSCPCRLVVSRPPCVCDRSRPVFLLCESTVSVGSIGSGPLSRCDEFRPPCGSLVLYRRGKSVWKNLSRPYRLPERENAVRYATSPEGGRKPILGRIFPARRISIAGIWAS